MDDHNWRVHTSCSEIIQNFFKTPSHKGEEAKNFVLITGIYVGIEEIEDESMLYEEKIAPFPKS